VTPSKGNGFEDFLAYDDYMLPKNHLYNYLLRPCAVLKYMLSDMGELSLKVGSGRLCNEIN
jgi:hypothetical protein